MFANIIDSSQVRVQHGSSSRSAARSSLRSTQDPAEVEQLREELRRHQDYLKQQAAQHEYYATQIQQHQTLIQQLAQAQGIHVPVPPTSRSLYLAFTSTYTYISIYRTSDPSSYLADA
ncbi:uncharacterized protein [Zea mays]|uniref:uncharacterized protein n=1 Tax=Zea mays TaxID=4577 RepID=UPI001652B142|nr:uncharacterized protein LOC109945636 [Zea mays]